MKFAEIDLFGVYVAPMALLMVATWVATIGLRRLAVRVRLLAWVWHPALFVFAVYVIILSSLTFVASHMPRALP
jgi:protein AaeX